MSHSSDQNENNVLRTTVLIESKGDFANDIDIVIKNLYEEFE